MVNHELPDASQDYVRHIGRTGRAGTQGETVSLVCLEEQKQLKNIERLLNGTIPKVMVPCYDPSRANTVYALGLANSARPEHKQRFARRKTV